MKLLKCVKLETLKIKFPTIFNPKHLKRRSAMMREKRREQ